MTAEDLPAVLEIERESHAAPWSEPLFRRELENPDRTFYLVAKVAGSLAGYAGYWRILPEVNIVNIAVTARFRRTGIGRLLLRRLEEQAVSEGANLATLEVRVGNAAAIGLYESEGYRLLAIRKGFYPPNNEDGYVMAKDLAAEPGATLP